MKPYPTVILAALLAALMIVGCQNKNTASNTTGDKKLVLTKPSDVTIQRNGDAEITIKISREGFRDAVTVSFAKLPEGVEPKDKDMKIAAEATSGTFHFHAKDNAPLVGNHDAQVTVSAEGLKVSEGFKITIK